MVTGSVRSFDRGFAVAAFDDQTCEYVLTLDKSSRVIVSVGAVGASAPTDFEED